MIRDWLQLFRAHTAPATILIFETFYLLGGGSFLSLQNLMIILFAMLVHWAGFGHNSVSDFARGFDFDDPYKKHFPLVRGVINLNKAHIVIHTMYGVLTIWAIVNVFIHPGNKVYSLAALALWIIFGHAYNDGVDKATRFNFVPISISYVFLCLHAYFLNALYLTTEALLMTIYTWFLIFFEIAYLGELKELEYTREPNLLRSIGTHIDNKGVVRVIRFGTLARLLAAIKVFSAILPYIIAVISGDSLASTISFIFIILIFVAVDSIVRDQLYNRNKLLEKSAIIEILSIFVMLFSIIAWTTIIPAIVLSVFAIVYFVAFNKLLWKTTIRPQV
ncbi:MAG: hypothetical protein J7K33_09870 [Candidatus Marinimicrobia bacterium]|nr:hypothetical protein [Candidatus Neomarinimicrobiota bacterium]